MILGTGFLKFTFWIFSFIDKAALFIKEQWNGALTGRIIPLFFFSFRFWLSISIIIFFPLTTTCSSLLSFAISHTSLVPNVLISFSTSFNCMPKIAIIAPSPFGTAACIALPLSWSKKIALSKSNDPEHTKAVYSPKECPAKYFASPKFKLYFLFKTLYIETPTVIMAGCAFCVNLSSSSGPLRMISDNEKPNVLSAVAKISLTKSNLS